MTRVATMHHALEAAVRTSLEKGANDLFLLPNEPPAYRTSSGIERLEEEPFTAELVASIADSLFSREEMAALGKTANEIHRSLVLDGVRNVRLTAALSNGCPTLTVQLAAPVIADVETLQVPGPILQSVLTLKGLAIFSGLFGSGKATTAYSVLDYINSRVACHICTVEDPIYARITPKRALVQQREVGLDVRDVPGGLKAAALQDADVVFVSELHDLEQLRACIAVADQGKLVILVLHLGADPSDVLARLVESFPVEEQPFIRKALARVLNVVCSQVLLPTRDKRRIAAYAYLLPHQEMREAIATDSEINKTGPSATLAASIRELETLGLIDTAG